MIKLQHKNVYFSCNYFSTSVTVKAGRPVVQHSSLYRDEINSLQIQLSRTQAGPDRAVKQEQEQISPNHIQRFNLISVEVELRFLFLLLIDNHNRKYCLQ